MDILRTRPHYVINVCGSLFAVINCTCIYVLYTLQLKGIDSSMCLSQAAWLEQDKGLRLVLRGQPLLRQSLLRQFFSLLYPFIVSSVDAPNPRL